MIWRDRSSAGGGELDVDREQELRIVTQARAGAAWAVSALVARYQPPVVRYLVRLTGNPERARQMAEGIFVRMGRRVRGPHGGEHLRLWLLRAATDMGLEALRRPERTLPPRLVAPSGPAGMLPGRVSETPMGRLVGAWNGRRRATSAPRPAPRTQEFIWQTAPREPASEPVNTLASAEWEPRSPREALRHRLVRAVLAELPYADAQCLALHLVAGLNQSEVATALGISAPVARQRVVRGLQLFGPRYEAALASLGLPEDVITSPAAEAESDMLDTTLEAVEAAVAADLAEPTTALVSERDAASPAPVAAALAAPEEWSAADVRVEEMVWLDEVPDARDVEATDGPLPVAQPAILATHEPSETQADTPGATDESSAAGETSASQPDDAFPPLETSAAEESVNWDVLWPVERAPAAHAPGGPHAIVVDADPGPAASLAGAPDVQAGSDTDPEAQATILDTPHAAAEAVSLSDLGAARSADGTEAPAEADPAPGLASVAAAGSVEGIAEGTAALEADHFLLVVDGVRPASPAPDRWRVFGTFRETRRARVLSADGEAEDPADAPLAGGAG